MVLAPFVNYNMDAIFPFCAEAAQPSVFLVINNDPNVQLIAIEYDSRAFTRPSTVINILENNINPLLEKLWLRIYIRPLFSKNEFWDVVRSHKNRLKCVEFFMLAPNLASISKGLQLDLAELKNRTNSAKTDLTLRSPKNENLTLSEDDEFIQSLVYYSSEGGGTIHVTAKNVKKKIKTEDSVKSVEVDEINFVVDNAPYQLVQALKELLSIPTEE
jgi:hypothetical protein